MRGVMCRVEPGEQPHAKLLLPETERVASRIMVLPTGTAVGPEDMTSVCQITRTAVAQAPEVRQALERRRKIRQESPSGHQVPS
jgi:hypothetical protein